MDTSETYIQMCDCEEIQGYALLVLGNKAPFHESVFFCSVCHTERGNCKAHPDLDKKEHTFIWLPRIDQLQEMVKQRSMPWMLRDASDFGFDHDTRVGPLLTFTSMEQLWLAFVMKEKYNKTWDGEEWHSVQT